MPKINVPPAMMVEFKEAMMSTSEKILQSRSGAVEYSANRQLILDTQ